MFKPDDADRQPGHNQTGPPVPEVKKPRLLRMAEVEIQVRMSRSAIYRATKKGDFPASLKMGGVTVWVDEEIQDYIAHQIDTRPGGLEGKT